MWVRGLKQSGLCDYIGGFSSHPVWVRGLKHIGVIRLFVFTLSHPVWVRGLKLIFALSNIKIYTVAPRVGAWIETTIEGVNLLSLSSRTPCGCVD